MNKTTTLSLILVSILVACVIIQTVKSQSTYTKITINTDGSISPSTAPIVRDGNVYTMTENISVSVTIQKSHLVFDGAGYTIQSPGWSWALKLAPSTPIEPAISNITVRNVHVMEDPNASAWAWGIMLENTVNSTITNCTISDIRDSLGIWLQDFSTGNTIIGNNLTNVHRSAIAVWASNNTVVGNQITGCGAAIDISSASNNVIFGNYIADNNIGINCWSGNPLPPGLKNLIYYNSFINNNLTFLNQAIFISDTSVLLYPALVNVWDNGTFGNYWNDYNGTDANGDGIGDMPYYVDDHYNIEGANDTDHYPLMNQVNTSEAIALYQPIAPNIISNPVSTQSPEPSPTPTSTVAPKSTNTPSPNPSQTSSPMPSQSPVPTAFQTPDSSSAVPEMPATATTLIMIVIACLVVVATKLRKRRHRMHDSKLSLEVYNG